MRKMQLFRLLFLLSSLTVFGCRSVDHGQPPATPAQPTKAVSNASETQPIEPPTPPGTTNEKDTLSQIVQLTEGFDRAGEAYFSPDMKWIVFQA